MQRNRTCPNCGAHVDSDSTPAPGDVPRIEGHGVTLGPPLVERLSRDYLGRPFGVAGIDDVDISVIDK